MAGYIYAVIKGEKFLDEYCEKRWNERPHFMESFAHINEVTIERIEEMSPTDDGYKQYFILYMVDPKRESLLTSFSQIRKRVHEDIRTGNIALLNDRVAGRRRG